jgi:hypothetical protein
LHTSLPGSRLDFLNLDFPKHRVLIHHNTEE